MKQIRLIILSSLLALLMPALVDAYSLGFNCGAPEAYTARDGRLYEADRPYTPTTGAGYIGGENGKSPDQVKSGGTRDFALYLQDRRGLSEYRFDVPNGFYVVKLHFSETEHLWRTLRVFDVWIEGQKVLADFDIFDKVQRNYVIDYQFASEVTDGRLNVRMKATTGEPVLSAIYVFRRTPDKSRPASPRGLFAIDGFKQAILDWNDNQEDDIAGYEVTRIEDMGGGLKTRTYFSPSSRFIDDDVEAYKTYRYYVEAVDVYGNKSGHVKTVSVTPYSKMDSKLPVYELFVDESHLVYLSKHVWDDVTIPVIFRHEGVEYDRARMRYRGGGSRRLVLKPSIKLIFADDQLFQGRKKLNLQSDTWDASLMRSKLAFDEYQIAGALAPNAEWVHLQLNGQFIGVYTAVDQIDERFLTINGRPATGNIYKPFDFLVLLKNDEDYERLAEKETNKGQGAYDIQEFVEIINVTPAPLIREKLLDVLDVEEYLNWYSANQLLSNWDIAGHNFYLYHDLDRDKWEIIGWDPDVSYVQYEMPIDEGTRNSPMYGEPYWWDRLLDRVLAIPQFRRMYCLRLIKLLETTFADGERLARMEAGYQRILFDAERDVRKPGWHENDIWFYPSLNALKKFVAARNRYLRSVVYDYMPPASVNLFMNEIGMDVPGEGWIELYNCSQESVALTGLSLSDDYYRPNKWPLPDMTIPPRGYVVWKERQLSPDFVFDPDTELIGLYAGKERIDPLYYPDFESGDRTSYGRIRDGSSQWVVFQDPTPGASNQWLAPVTISTRSDTIVQQVVQGGPLQQPLNLRNRTDQPQRVVLWDELFLPDGRPYRQNPITLERDVQLAPDESLRREWVTRLPEDLPLGLNYRVLIHVGLGDPLVSESDPPQGIPLGVPSTWDTLSIRLSLLSQDALRHLVINELMADNQQTVADEYGEYEDWVELYNGSDQPINLDGMYLSDDRREPDKWPIRDAEIPPGGYLLFWLDSDEPQGIRHAGFRLSASGEGIGIFDTDENQNAMIDWISFGMQKTDVSYGRYPDGEPSLECFIQPTPGAPNVSSGRIALRINELMSDNRTTIADEAGERDAWIELFNPGCEAIRLEGWKLIYHEVGWSFPPIVVPPGGYLLVWADGDEAQGDLHTNFRLDSNGGTLSLQNPDGNDRVPVDSVRFSQQPPDTSFGRYPNGLGDWEILIVPTPGMENRFPTIVINEIMAQNRLTVSDESGEYDDWIELYNPTGRTLNLSGMFLSDDPDDPTRWRLPAVEIPAQGFLLIWADGDVDQGPLHAGFSLNSDGEVVALFDAIANGNALLDSIEFGEQQADVSYGRYPDGSASLERFRKPTPGTSNISSSVTIAGPLSLLQNYPNPFTSTTSIPYTLSESVPVILNIYNIQGQSMRRFDLGVREVGAYVERAHAVSWDGRNNLGERAAPGIYFYTLQSGEYVVTRKLMMIR